MTYADRGGPCLSRGQSRGSAGVVAAGHAGKRGWPGQSRGSPWWWLMVTKPPGRKWGAPANLLKSLRYPESISRSGCQLANPYWCGFSVDGRSLTCSEVAYDSFEKVLVDNYSTYLKFLFFPKPVFVMAWFVLNYFSLFTCHQSDAGVLQTHFSVLDS